MRSKIVALTLIGVLYSGCTTIEKAIGNTVAGDYNAICTFAKDNKIVAVVETKGQCDKMPDGTLGGCHINGTEVK